MHPTADQPPRLPDRRALLAAWLACGVLDLSAAFLSYGLQYGRPPRWVLRAVAGALLGRELAFGGGAWAGLLGLALHFSVAFAWTAVFYLLARRFLLLRRRAIPAGLLFGGFVYVFMNCVTIPLSSWLRSLYLGTPVNWRHAPFDWPQMGIHLVCVGLAIALVLRHWPSTPNPRVRPTPAGI